MGDAVDKNQLAGINRLNKVEQDIRKWAVEQSVEAASVGEPGGDLIERAKKLENYVMGRVTS